MNSRYGGTHLHVGKINFERRNDDDDDDAMTITNLPIYFHMTDDSLHTQIHSLSDDIPFQTQTQTQTEIEMNDTSIGVSAAISENGIVPVSQSLETDTLLLPSRLSSDHPQTPFDTHETTTQETSTSTSTPPTPPGGGDDEEEEEEKPTVSGKELKRIFALAKTQKRLMIPATFSLFISGLGSLAIPSFMGQIVDAISQSGSVEDRNTALSEAVLTLCILIPIIAFFSFIRTSFFVQAGERVVANLRCKLYFNLLSQDLSFHDNIPSGKLVNRLSSDCTLIQNAVSYNISGLFRYTLLTFGSIIVLLTISPILTGVMLLMIPLFVCAAISYGKWVKKLSKRLQEILAQATALSTESLAHISFVRSNQTEHYEQERYAKKIDESFVLAKKRGYAFGFFVSFLTLAGNYAMATVLYLGGQQVIDGDISAGTLISFLLYTIFLGTNMAGLGGLYGDFAKASGASSRVFELIDEQPKVNALFGFTVSSEDVKMNHPPIEPPTNLINESTFSNFDCGSRIGALERAANFSSETFALWNKYGDTTSPGPQGIDDFIESNIPLSEIGDIHSIIGFPTSIPLKFTWPKRDGALIEFHNVSFCYPTRPDVKVLKNISFKIFPNQMTALVGATGNGKSSIMSLISAEYQPTEGTIFWEGIPYPLLHPNWLRSQIGLVPQATWLFSDSVFANIAYGKRCKSTIIDPNDIQDAARQAEAKTFIDHIGGIDTHVGPSGIQLSVGQVQRILVARALYRNAPVNLWDEFSSALDSETEHALTKALEKWRKHKTFVVVAHRLSTVITCDQILVLEQGTIVEQGKHAELLAQGGNYKNLVNKQLIQDLD